MGLQKWFFGTIKKYRHKKIGYNMDILWQIEYMFVNPAMVDIFASFFNCTTVGSSLN